MGKYEDFLELLEKRPQSGDKAGFDKKVFEKYGRELTVMITDSSNFTRKTKEYGIVQFLSVLQKSYEILNKVIESHDGIVVKEWADDIFAVFSDPETALNCAFAMQKKLGQVNKGKKDGEIFGICAGLACGEILFLDKEIFGDAVNMASKLGEDLASGDDILISEEVYRRIHNNFPDLNFLKHRAAMSGVEFDYFEVNR